MINKKFINSILALSLLIIIFNFYFFVKEQSLNQYADWLINYQGGFVRRGLIGEIFFQIHSLLNIRLDILVFFSVSLLYIFFYKNFSKILEKVNFHFLNLLIIFSPISFIYPVMEEKASGRKDILFLFLLSVVALYLKKISFYKQKYIIILFSGIIIFSHTGFFFLLPAFILLFIFFNLKQKSILIFKEILIISVSIVIFLLIILNNKIIDTENIKQICESLSIFVRDDCLNNGYISTLNWTIKQNLELKESLWMTKNYNLYYALAFLISFFPILFAFKNSKFANYKKINVLFFFSIFIISSLPLYYIGVDYGRYMHLTYISLIMIYFISLKEKIIFTSYNQPLILKKIKFKFHSLLIIIFLYGFSFTIPHCCENNFKFNYSKVLLKISEKLN